jgi:hypothetical protein
MGQDQADDLQPRVTFSLEVKKKNVEDSPKSQIQTTVSQRNLDIEY